MNRWLIRSVLGLAIVPVGVASASPTTRPEVEPKMPSIKDFGGFHLFKLEPRNGLPKWNEWPDYRQYSVPSQVAPQFDIKPHGRSFQFNGVTVYIEPVV
jgi:hypothetical protein